MSMVKRALGGLAVGLVFVGCSSEADDNVVAVLPGVDSGTYVQNWSIEGQQSASKCREYGADRMRVVVFDDDGSVHATEFGACASFSLRLTLLERRYTGTATFIDANGNAVSKTRDIAAFAIVDDRETANFVNFTADDMKL